MKKALITVTDALCNIVHIKTTNKAGNPSCKTVISKLLSILVLLEVTTGCIFTIGYYCTVTLNSN